MENQNKSAPPPSPPDSVSPPPTKFALPNSEEHISLSPPLGSPADSYSSSLHSKHSSGEHISLSPPAGSPVDSPARSSLASDHISFNHSPENEKLRSPEKKHPPPPPVVVSRDVFKGPAESRVLLKEPTPVVERPALKEPKAAAGKADSVRAAAEGGGGIGRRRHRPSLSILRGAKNEKMVKKAALGFRVFALLFCLVSFSVMAADRDQGWAVDSFDRYREFRYCMSINVIGFVYSAAQAFDLSYNLATGKYIVQHQQRLRYYFNFAADQIIAYLLISASSSAAIRVDDWQSNWGKDKFPDMATASISMSFLAFVALAICSLISGYALCASKSV